MSRASRRKATVWHDTNLGLWWVVMPSGRLSLHTRWESAIRWATEEMRYLKGIRFKEEA